MQILLTSDIHNGIPGKLRDTIWSMDLIRKYANKHKINEILILGDLFHDRQNIGVDVINAVYDQLKQSKEDGQTWTCFPGNHDTYLKNSWEINSLRPLENVIKVISDIKTIEIYDQRFTIIPFIYQEAKYMEELKKIKYKDKDILLTHIGVNNATLNECFLIKNWSVVNFKDSPYDIVYAGHYHCHQQVDEKVWYPGSPIPFRYDEGVVEHGFLIYETEDRSTEFIKTFEVYKDLDMDYKPPDYLTIIDKDLPTYLHLIEGNNVKIDLSRDYTPNELNKIREILKKKGALSTKWSLQKEKMDDVQEQIKTNTINMNSPETLFKSWLDIDKPKLDHELLHKWHEQVVKIAQERIITEKEEEE